MELRRSCRLGEASGEGCKVRAGKREGTSLAETASAELSADAEALASKLRAWRALEAKRLGVPAFIVLHDKTLQSVAQARPSTPNQLLADKHRAWRTGRAVCARRPIRAFVRPLPPDRRASRAVDPIRPAATAVPSRSGSAPGRSLRHLRRYRFGEHGQWPPRHRRCCCRNPSNCRTKQRRRHSFICTRRAPRFNRARLPSPDLDCSVIRVDGCVAAVRGLNSKSSVISTARVLPAFRARRPARVSGSEHDTLSQKSSFFFPVRCRCCLARQRRSRADKRLNKRPPVTPRRNSRASR